VEFEPQESLRRVRDGERLDDREIRSLVRGIADGSLSDGQIGALAMAIRIRGMSEGETHSLTLAMRDSGGVLDWQRFDLDGPVVDKHSTGGVADAASLVLAPMLAACGMYVPMISGCGLGHTGGTLDKLGAIPGYRTQVPVDVLQRTVATVGTAIVGAGAGLAPADRRLYAIRDVTATVDSLPLITASILSKKLAAGTEALVLDVKTGSGASLAHAEASRQLAHALVDLASSCGLRTTALITSMDQPLMSRIGNALEIDAVLDVLQGHTTEPLLQSLCTALGAELMLAVGCVGSHAEAVRRLERALASGAAAESFRRMVSALGGPVDVFAQRGSIFPPAPVVLPVPAPREGWLAAIDTRAVGLSLVGLGGGRSVPGAAIDTRVGFSAFAALGDVIDRGQALALVHAADMASAERARAELIAAIAIRDTRAEEVPLLRERIAPRGRAAA
jgi:thymidine phosphorylase